MKRIIALLLLAVMLLSVPLAIAESSINAAYGQCGDKVHYKLTQKGSDYELEIYGKGKMWDYGSGGRRAAPWEGKNITSAVIKDGVTYVGAYSFFGMGYVGDSIESVPGTKPTLKVEMADSITRIGEYAFAYTNAGSYTLPKNLKKIDFSAFSGTDAKTITFNAALEDIGDHAFSSVSISHMWLGNNVKNIGNKAFAWTDITNARIPESVKTIGEEAFYNCDNLKYVYLYNDNIEIDDFVDFDEEEAPAFTRGAPKTCSKITIVARKGSTGAAYAEKWGYKYAEMNPRKLVKKISLNKKEVTIAQGRTAKITATVKPSNAENQKLKWESADETVATVKKGVITAVGIGETVVTVSAKDGSGVTAQVKVTVTPNEPKKITLNKTKATLLVGKKLKLVATVKPAYVPDKTVVWTSSDETIAKVNKKGNVTAVAPGTCIITATTVNGKTVTCTIKVKAKK